MGKRGRAELPSAVCMQGWACTCSLFPREASRKLCSMTLEKEETEAQEGGGLTRTSSLLRGLPDDPCPRLCLPWGRTSPPRSKRRVDSDAAPGTESRWGPDPRPAGTWPSDMLRGSHVHTRVHSTRASRASWNYADVR